MTPQRPLAALLAVAIALAAGASPDAQAKRAKTGAETENAGSRPFIEQSLIAAPKRIGGFELEGHRYDPSAKYAGVGFRYRDPAHPELRIDIFVYPAGQMSESQAMKTGMESFVASFDEGVRQGYYDRFELLGRAPFELQAATATGDDTPTGEEAHADGEGPERDASVDDLLAALVPPPIRGERLDLRYRMPMGFEEPVPMRSRGYLFYKQLYYFKARLTATEAAIPGADFDALTDRAVRTLIPAIQARNIGGCADKTLRVDPDALKDGDEGANARALAAAFARMKAKSCYETRSEAGQGMDGGNEIVTIAYDPDDWGDTGP